MPGLGDICFHWGWGDGWGSVAVAGMRRARRRCSSDRVMSVVATDRTTTPATWWWNRSKPFARAAEGRQPGGVCDGC